MNLSKQTLLTTTFIAGLAAFAPSLAAAQSKPAPQNTTSQAAHDESTEVETVVVTGSRIRRTEYSSTQPVQIITSEEATLEGLVDTTEILQGSTIANTATQINNYYTGYVTTGGPGVNTLSLRGLGANRTLVLLNGRRAGPAGARGTVGPTDLNVIPSSLIERVEILTDGASSIYGSDAIAGVVNIITKQNFDGGAVNAYVSQPLEKGGEEYNINANYGWTFDRGYFSIGADYYERKALLFQDRDTFACPQNVVYWDSALNQRADPVDPKTGTYKCTSTAAELLTLYVNGGAGGTIDYAPVTGAVAGGGPRGCDLAGYQQVRVFATGFGACALPTAAPAGYTAAQWSQVLRDYYARGPLHSDRYGTRTAVSGVTRTSISAFGGFDLTPKTEIFGELLLNRRESSQNSWRQMWAAIPSAHPRVPVELRNVNGTPISHVEPTLLLNSHNDQQVDYARGVLGIRGSLDIGRGWDWELVGQYSRSEADYGSTFIYNDRFLAATSFTTMAQLTSGCNTALLKTATACPTGGVDFFSPSVVAKGELRPEDAAFLLGYESGTTIYEHKYIEGLISGELFDLPAGSVGLALGFQVRQEKLDDLPGLQERTGNYWGQTAAGHTVGEDTIKEAFAELEVPLLKDMPFFNTLTLNLSGRYSDYKSYGDNSTYKVGLNWAITPEYRIRASKGTSFRAPALYELYLANQTGFQAQASIDPCRSWGLSTNELLRKNCAAAGIPDNHGTLVSSSALVTTGGGLGILKPETADSFSVGFIWTPSFVNLNVALDYYEVEIQDQVQALTAASIVNGCYLSENFPNDPLCQLFKRNGAGPDRPYEITAVNSSYVNIARQYSEGLDLNARYRKEFGFGDLTLNARFSYILKWESQLRTASVPNNNLDQIGSPDWVGSVSARFDKGDWTVFWNTDIVDSVNNDRFYASNTGTFLGQPIYYNRKVDTYLNHSASVRKTFDKWQLQVGVRNLFDEGPTITSASGGGRGAANVPLSSQYDYLGRRVFMNISRTW
ncbi:TonB-dependent receptor [Brevundimonas sp.]|uniref:TonB-dependent receptor plug domain-containing protein n=1 Tax=Brevundimonas sp. TaxID=1871086 RepID=UPI001AD1E79E|nr:TonB-dependent receptor [Brevundimonas sp.]MBN9466368.1 TonB-dependent receptor [Brevundimonas sp.]